MRKQPGTKLTTNESKLVELSVLGEVTSAVWPAGRAYRPGGDGTNRVLPGTGGICYTHRIGDSALDLVGDHVEPGVTIRATDNEQNSALNTLACIGNEARVISGDAKGALGRVTGKHGGVEHVMVDFDDITMERLCVGDKIQIRAVGVGLAIEGAQDLRVLNCSPLLLSTWEVKIRDGVVHVPVTHRIPAAIMGSGLGAVTCHSGDYDIQMFDPGVVKEFGLDTLRFGDLVAINDADHSYGRRYLGGAISIGVIVHSRSDMSGHGPGVTSLLTSATGKIIVTETPDANIGRLLSIGRFRVKKARAKRRAPLRRRQG